MGCEISMGAVRYLFCLSSISSANSAITIAIGSCFTRFTQQHDAESRETIADSPKSKTFPVEKSRGGLLSFSRKCHGARWGAPRSGDGTKKESYNAGGCNRVSALLLRRLILDGDILMKRNATGVDANDDVLPVRPEEETQRATRRPEVAHDREILLLQPTC